MRILILAFAILAIGFQVNAQPTNSGSQTYLVTSVTMRIDSVTTVQQMDQIRALIKSHSEIRDFDIKGEKCNFTMNPSNTLLPQIEQELAAEGYSSRYLFIRDNQTFSSVPFEDHGSIPEDDRFDSDPRYLQDSIRIRYEQQNR